jgi:uroporphyrinogen decarboxylase
MNSKERVIATLNRAPTDRTPIDCWLYQKQFVERLAAEYGSRDEFLDEFNIDIFVGFVPYPNQFGRKFDVTELVDINLGDPRDEKWLSHSEWNEDFAGVNVREAVEQHGHKRAVIAHTWGIVEGSSQLLGIEQCWLSLGKNPELMAAWFDRYADWLCGLMDSLRAADVDIVTISDDWGSNRTMLFSPRMWRNLVKPYTKRVVQYARSLGLFVNLHSDGYIMQILDDIVEIGFHSWHPLQESAGMDPQVIKERYGDKLVCYGSLDVIDGLFAYEGDELADYIRKRFAIYGPGGGFIFNTGHFVQKDIPPQRLVDAYTLVNELAPQYGTL